MREAVAAPMTGPAGRAIVIGTRLIAPHGMRNLLPCTDGKPRAQEICGSSRIILGEAWNQTWETVGNNFLACQAIQTSLSDWNESSYVMFFPVSAEHLHEIRKFEQVQAFTGTWINTTRFRAKYFQSVKSLLRHRISVKAGYC